MEEIAAEFINGILSSDQQGNSLISGQSSQDVDEHEKSINFNMNIMCPIYTCLGTSRWARKLNDVY